MDGKIQYVAKKEGQEPKKQTKKDPAPNTKKDPNRFATDKVASLKTFGLPFIDSHAHLDVILDARELSYDDLDKMIKDEFTKDYLGCVNVCCDVKNFDMCEQIMENIPTVRGTFGIHPHEAKFYTPEIEKRIEKNMSHPKCIAWGECGLDFFKNISPQETQIKVFTQQIKKAVEHKKTLVVHSRDAEDESFAIMSEHLPADWRVHLHCFTGTVEFAKKMLEKFPNLYFGFTGVITFRNSVKICDAVKAVPMNRILLETDGPFMAPDPFRGKTAIPGMIPLIAAKIAQLKGLEVESVLKQALENTFAVYNHDFGYKKASTTTISTSSMESPSTSSSTSLKMEM